MKYKLIKRKNPLDKGAEPKWYASPMNLEPKANNVTTRAACENTSISPVEMQSSFDLWMNHAIRCLIAGESVRMGNIGTLRMTFKSKGVDDITKFNPLQMIYDVRILFTPSQEFRESVVGKISFENGGVLESGIDYASLAAFYKAMGISPGTGGGSGTGEDGGDDGGSGSMG